MDLQRKGLQTVYSDGQREPVAGELFSRSPLLPGVLEHSFHVTKRIRREVQRPF